jgi:hypothetical protein
MSVERVRCKNHHTGRGWLLRSRLSVSLVSADCRHVSAARLIPKQIKYELHCDYPPWFSVEDYAASVSAVFRPIMKMVSRRQQAGLVW